MRSAKVFRRWKRQQQDLLRKLDCLVRLGRRRGTAEDIHELRVVARRLRLLVRLGAPWFGKDASSDFRDWSRQLSVATDPLRDLDVALEWIEQVPEHAEVTRRIRVWRRRLWRRSRPRLDRPPGRLGKALGTPAGGRKHEAFLQRRCAKLMRKLRDRVAGEAAGFFQLDPPAQHDFRRVLRRWRYLRELELPRRHHRKDMLLQRLVSSQSALGERQNLQIADRVLKELASTVPTEEARRALAVERRRWERRMRAELSQLAGGRVMARTRDRKARHDS